jgi:hypothetical protein
MSLVQQCEDMFLSKVESETIIIIKQDLESDWSILREICFLSIDSFFTLAYLNWLLIKNHQYKLMMEKS